MSIGRVWARVLLALTLISACTPATLVGEALPSPIAPNFGLTDSATGEHVELASFAGRVVLITFLYTHCVDTCPFTAETIRTARDKLGDAARDVSFIAVSVDPIGDTPAAARTFIADHRLEGSLHYLLGTRAELARVWQAYGVVQASGTNVLHTDVLYLVDKHLRGRVVLHSDVTPDVLAADLAILARER